MSLNLKKFLVILPLLVFLAFSFLAPAQAGLYSLDDTETLLEDTAEPAFGEEGQPLAVTVGRIIGIFLAVLGAIFLVLLVYGGFTWMTAGGDTEKVQTATKIIRNSVIGLIIIVAAYALSQFIVERVITATTEAS